MYKVFLFRSLFLLSLLCPLGALSQVPGTGEEAQGGGDRGTLTIWLANDVFYFPDKTDQYYTSGLKLEYSRFKSKSNPQNEWSKRNYWQVAQDIFTPRDIETLVLLSDDRPFASYLTAARGTEKKSDRQLSIGHRGTVGVLGKYSGGGAMQNAFHRMLSFAEELHGWPLEVKPDLILNYQGEVAKNWSRDPAFELSTFSRARLGSLYTDLSAGGRVGLTLNAASATRYLKVGLTSDWRAVGYNATLSGGLFNKDERYRGVIRPSRLVSQLEFSVVARFDCIALQASVVRLGREFEEGVQHIYGTASASYYW